MVACACHGQCLNFFFLIKLTNLRYLHCCARTQRCVQSCTNSVIVIDDILRPCTSSSVTLSSPLCCRCCARTQRCVQACTNSVIVIDDILRSRIPSSASLLSSPSLSFWRFWSWPQPSLPCWTVWLCALFYVYDTCSNKRFSFRFTRAVTTQTLSLRLPLFLAQRRGRYQARTAGLFTLHLKVVCCLRRRRGRRRRFQHVLS